FFSALVARLWGLSDAAFPAGVSHPSALIILRTVVVKTSLRKNLQIISTKFILFKIIINKY
ncbi:hypothetical protein ABDH65_09775, partial [Heyndrickxia ginsengihumi]|uniref:hypothetical protein n=1 Tax=Heyndrickxia ginsengihumi TaxID=363870 RepID=UPI003D1D7E9D